MKQIPQIPPGLRPARFAPLLHRFSSQIKPAYAGLLICKENENKVFAPLTFQH